MLFHYQVQGANWLAQRKTALLADEMGIGKSAQAIRACDLIQAKRILILTPAVGRENWLREFEKFSLQKRSISVFRLSQNKELSTDSTVCSYDSATLNFLNSEAERTKTRWDVLILDESHFLKGIDAKRTKDVFGKQGLVRKAERVWALSGTPAPNHPGEMWPLLYTFGQTQLSYEEFIARYCRVRETAFGRQITGANLERIPELRETINRIMLRRRKEDVLKELPPITFGDVAVEEGHVDLELDSGFVAYVVPKDRTGLLYKTLEKEQSIVDAVLDKVGMGKDGMNSLHMISRSVGSLRRYVGLQKLDGVAELVGSELEANAYHKVVIFAIHRGVIEGLRRKLFMYNPLTLYGDTSEGKRESHLEKFSIPNNKYRVFIGNIQACGTNISLTAAHNVVFAEQDWVPANNAQAAMRCHRIGQKNPVLVRFVGLANSIDERIAQTLKRKTRELTEIFDAKVLPISQRRCYSGNTNESGGLSGETTGGTVD